MNNPKYNIKNLIKNSKLGLWRLSDKQKELTDKIDDNILTLYSDSIEKELNNIEQIEKSIDIYKGKFQIIDISPEEEMERCEAMLDCCSRELFSIFSEIIDNVNKEHPKDNANDQFDKTISVSSIKIGKNNIENSY